MTERPNLRGAQQLWITRGHLAALGTATVFIAVLAFFLGLQMGKKSAPPPDEVVAGHMLPDPEDEDALEALLREVELARLEADAPTGDAAPARDLSFPETLRGEAEAPAEGPDDSVAVTTAIPPRAEDQPVPPVAPVDPGVTSGWVVQIASYRSAEEADARVSALASEDLDAYKVAALVGGETWFRVRVGGYSDKEAAAQARDALAVRLGTPDLLIAEAP